MQGTLAKPWGKHPPGTKITTEANEWRVKLDGLLVNLRRFRQLEADGFFAPAEPEKKVQGETFDFSRPAKELSVALLPQSPPSFAKIVDQVPAPHDRKEDPDGSPPAA